MTKRNRKLIYDKYGGRCAYCGCDLTGLRWHADHIKPIVRNHIWDKNKGYFKQTGTYRHPENETLNNYNPSCSSCNILKNSFSIEQFRVNIKQFINSLNKYDVRYKIVKRFGLINETNIDVKFYFEVIDSNELIVGIEKKHKNTILHNIKYTCCDVYITEDNKVFGIETHKERKERVVNGCYGYTIEGLFRTKKWINEHCYNVKGLVTI